MATKKVECHITLDPKFREKVEAPAKFFGFHISFLKGDEVMGPDILMYLTKSGDDTSSITNDMFRMRDALNNNGCTVLRAKVEEIVYDSKGK